MGVCGLYKSSLRVNLSVRAPERESAFLQETNRMVATTDCIEESKPIVGKKVRGKAYWKEVDQSTDHKITRVWG